MIATATTAGCTLSVRLHPAAKLNAITGTHNEVLKISLTTPPEGGRANAALIAFLADRLSIPRRSIEIISGPASRLKTLRLTGISAAEVETRLLRSLA